jgi:N utilization substance protein B
MPGRKAARDWAYKLIYEYLFTKTVREGVWVTPDVTSESVIFSEEDLLYIEDVYRGTLKKMEELTAFIEEFTDKYPVSRIFKADLAALFLSVYEMRYRDDIPLSVSINEAVEIVKKYSTEKSNQYVNGVLSSIYKKLNASGE